MASCGELVSARRLFQLARAAERRASEKSSIVQCRKNGLLYPPVRLPATPVSQLSEWSRPCLLRSHIPRGRCHASNEDTQKVVSPLDMEVDPVALEEAKKDRKEKLTEAIKRLSEADIEEAADKWKLQDELFQEVDYAMVDAFTTEAFAGNPAAICYLPYWPKGGDTWLQLIAREFNLSETAFLVKRRPKEAPLRGAIKQALEAAQKLPGNGEAEGEDEEDGEDHYDLRWFAPKTEVDLCGHATLASAHLLFSVGLATTDRLSFHTRSGILTARKVQPSTPPRPPQQGALPAVQDPKLDEPGPIELNFPAKPAVEASELAAAVGRGLPGVSLTWVGRSEYDVLVEVASEETVRQLQPDFAQLAALNVRGVIVTAAASTGPSDHSYGGGGAPVDFVSRFFAPSTGVPEDPVTGSAHCTLGPYWAAKLGKTQLEAYQCSERGGHVSVVVGERPGRVLLRGEAVVVTGGVLKNGGKSLKREQEKAQRRAHKGFQPPDKKTR